MWESRFRLHVGGCSSRFGEVIQLMDSLLLVEAPKGVQDLGSRIKV